VIVRLLRLVSSSALGRRDKPLESDWQVIGWWEIRRIPFNLIVGAAGIATSIGLLSIGLASDLLFGVPIGIPDPPLFAVIAVILYAVAANVCYTGGWIAELLVRRAWPEESNQFAPLTFTLGLAFAVVVTLLPAILVGATAVIYAVARAAGYDSGPG
jgi:hypothetical protein